MFSAADELIKLKGLLDAGVLTQDEYNELKNRVLKMTYETYVNEQKPEKGKTDGEVLKSKTNGKNTYDIFIVQFNESRRAEVRTAIMEIAGKDSKWANDVMKELPAKIKEEVSVSECVDIQKKLRNLGVIIQRIPKGGALEDYISRKHLANTNRQVKKSDMSSTQINNMNSTQIKEKKEQVIRCPKCNSTSITTGARGVNWTWGLIGASKTVNRCANCGYAWKPHLKEF